MENTHVLSIDKNSWHYRYYVFINELWGRHISLSSRTSICPYVQSMIWFTIFAIIVSPFALIGFVYLTLSRLFYNLVYPSELLERYWECDLDNWHDYPSFINSTYGNLAWYGAATTIALIVFGFLFTCAFTLFYNYHLIGYYTILAFAFIYSAILRLGWLIFHIPAGIWWTGKAFCHLVINFWNTTSFSSIFYWCGIGLGVLCLGWIIVAVFAEITFKIERISHERKELRESLLIQELPPREPTWLDKLWNKLWNSIYYFFVSKEEIIDGKIHKILSPAAIFWGFLVAIKHQICPIVEFVESDKQEQLS